MDQSGQREEAQRLAERIMSMAQHFAADNEAGFTAGYQPRPTRLESREIGCVNPVRFIYDRMSWLRAIAERDLAGWDWRLKPALGGGVIEVRARL